MHTEFETIEVIKLPWGYFIVSGFDPTGQITTISCRPELDASNELAGYTIRNLMETDWDGNPNHERSSLNDYPFKI
jgi:hypothetical protein